MSTGVRPATAASTNGVSGELTEWRDHARVFLQPIAAPSILGLYGFAAGTFMVTANLVGWYGNARSPLLIFPFAVAAGGIAQGAAALFAYKARDALATAIHGIWAAFWLGYGLLNIMIAVKLIPAAAPGAAVPELGYWFFALAAITLVGMIASLAESFALTSVLLPLWVGAALLGVFYIEGGTGWEKVGGYVTMASAFTAFYAASAMMLAATFGRAVLPVGKYRRESVGEPLAYPIQFALGEPGVKQGQ